MEELKYKEEIIQTRTGNVGSSDSKMLQQIATLGQVPRSAMKRMAVIKGLKENENITTFAMRLGDYIENATFDMLHESDERWESNKCLVSEKYSRPNCGCLTHVDYWLQDDEKKVITVGEQKATKRTFSQARDEYKYQLVHHWLLAKEYADKIGYKVKVLFAIYDTNDVEENHEYDSRRLTVKIIHNIEKIAKSYELDKAMDIVDAFLEGFNEFYEDEEIDASYLPEKVKTEFDTITTFLAEIKEKEQKIEDFKKHLCEFMQTKGIRSIKNDAWAITLVQPSESVSVDYKNLFAQEIEAKKPRVAKALKKKYQKTTKKNAYVMLKIKDNNNN